MPFRPMIIAAGLFLGAGGALAQSTESTASAPQGVALSIYEEGFGLVSELRRITPARGENVIRFLQLPSQLDASTVSFIPLAARSGLEILEQQYLYDLRSPEVLLNRYVGRPVEVYSAGERYVGRLLAAPAWRPEPAGLLALDVEPDGTRMFMDASKIDQVVLPNAKALSFREPMLTWRAQVDQEGPQNIRLTYRVDGLSWLATYEVVLDEDGKTAYFAGRIGLENRSGGAFKDAQIHIVAPAQGRWNNLRRSAVKEIRDSAPPLRYLYGSTEPSFEPPEGVARTTSYRLPQPVTLEDGDNKYVQYARVDALPVTRFYIYDGVRFDRFQRNRRNDWNYGTEFHSTVETHLNFPNEAPVGLGLDLPPGLFRLYQRRADASVELIGEDILIPTPADHEGHVRVGPARGLRGERERTGYAEITPLRVYEETFQIRLENNTEEPVEIRVVEHLYRWHDFEIVRADTEYALTGEQTIEFRPSLNPGGRRSIHYTVRYSW